DVQQAALLSGNVLTAAYQRLQDSRWQLEPRRSSRLGEPSLDEAGHENGVELETLGLVNRHHVDGVPKPLHLRGPLVLLRQQNKVQVAHVSLERTIGGHLTELSDELREAAHVGHRARGFAGLERRRQNLEVARP